MGIQFKQNYPSDYRFKKTFKVFFKLNLKKLNFKKFKQNLIRNL